MNTRRINDKNGRSGRAPIGNRDNTKKNIIGTRRRAHTCEIVFRVRNEVKAKHTPLKCQRKALTLSKDNVNSQER